jgi:diguanylate cyclase (GGDEF)-like protein/PAS domain S-box-containing protein
MSMPDRWPRSSNPTTRFIARVALAAALLDVMVGVMVAMGLAQCHLRYEERATIASRNLAVLLEHEISATLAKIDLVLISVADEVARVDAEPPGAPDTLDDFIRRRSVRLPEIHGLRTTDAAGNVTRGVGLAPGARVNLSDRAYFARLAGDAAAAMVISRPLVSRVDGEWEIVLARRINRADGAFAGIAYATIPLHNLRERFAALDLGAHGIVALRDAELAIITRHPVMKSVAEDIANSAISPQLRAPIRAGQIAGTYTAPAAFDQVVRTTSFRRLGDYPMVVVVGLATQDYLAQWRSEAAIAIALGAAFMVLTSLIAVQIFRAWKRRERYVEALGVQERKFRTLLESSPDALVIADAQRVIVIVNRQAERMFGYAQHELIGRSIDELLPPNAQAATDDAGPRRDRDLWAVTRSGRRFPVGISFSPIDTDQGGMVAAAVRDMTDRRASEQRIAYLAHHDGLTGLPNRVVMQSRLELAMAQADGSGTRIALLFIDLDNFKTINDSLGHLAGDGVLKAVARRLGEGLREADIASRHGGDEFLVALTGLDGADAARAQAERLMRRFVAPCPAEGHAVATTLSVGVALYPDDGADYGTLLKNADIAMYQAKAAGRNACRFFNEQMNAAALEHARILNGLRLATERGEFVLHYQPQIELAGGRVVGVEALLRWNHPELGLVAPGRFIPVAEESGLIVDIGRWVLHEACRQAMAWRAQGLPPMWVAVNLSAVQFERDDVEASVRQALDASGLPPCFLELELTESILIRDIEGALASTRRLKSLGVKLAIDDFGTGYSSLSYLKRLAFDTLKIDRSFIRELADDPDNAAIVEAILQMARSLGLRTIAEGVEDEPALQCLIAMRCDEAQGYLIARPMPASQFAVYLADANESWRARTGPPALAAA